MKKSELRQIIREEIQRLTEKKMVKRGRGAEATPYEIWYDPKKGYYAKVDKRVQPKHWTSKHLKMTFDTEEEAEVWVREELHTDSIRRWVDTGGRLD